MNPQPSRNAFARPTAGWFALAIAAMAAVVLASNLLVQFAINDWLTWGAFTYPVAFLVSELVNRRFGPALARRVAWVGFAVAVLVVGPNSGASRQLAASVSNATVRMKFPQAIRDSPESRAER